jgi:hypothetical protein
VPLIAGYWLIACLINARRLEPDLSDSLIAVAVSWLIACLITSDGYRMATIIERSSSSNLDLGMRALTASD